MENNLYDGEYFIQKIKWKGLNATDPVTYPKNPVNCNIPDEVMGFM